MGPPAVPPAVFALISGLIGFPCASRGANRLTLENLLFWLNQKADPFTRFVPLLVVVVTSVACMYSALFPAVVTLNSSIDSTEGNRSFIGPPPRVRWIDTPSTENEVMYGRLPASEMPPSLSCWTAGARVATTIGLAFV